MAAGTAARPLKTAARPTELHARWVPTPPTTCRTRATPANRTACPFNASEGDRLDFSQIYERFPDLSVGVRPTEDGDILITFAHADGTPVGSVTLHRLAYQPINVFPDPGAPHAPPYEHPDTDPGTPYAPPYEFPEDPGHPVHPGIPSISEFLLPYVDIHAEPVVADVM